MSNAVIPLRPFSNLHNLNEARVRKFVTNDALSGSRDKTLKSKEDTSTRKPLGPTKYLLKLMYDSETGAPQDSQPLATLILTFSAALLPAALRVMEDNILETFIHRGLIQRTDGYWVRLTKLDGTAQGTDLDAIVNILTPVIQDQNNYED